MLEPEKIFATEGTEFTEKNIELAGIPTSNCRPILSISGDPLCLCVFCDLCG
jgi:hypothetical protein